MSNTFKKFMAALTSLFMALALVPVTALAAGTGTITIMPPEKTDSNTVTTYNIYKVFQADASTAGVSYKLLDGKSTNDTAWTQSGMGTYFSVDSAGNVTALAAAKGDEGELTSGAVSAIKSYVEKASLSAEKFTTTTENSSYASSVAQNASADVKAKGTTATTATGLANGYYYVTTTTGTAVSITTAKPDASVQDKNQAPTVDDKKIISVNTDENNTTVVTGSIDKDGHNAIAQLNSKVTYEATVSLGNGSQNVKFHDAMGSGLTYNNDVKVYTDATRTTEVINTNNSVFTVQPTADQGDTLTISFADTDAAATYYIVYSATVNSDALNVDTGKNTATISYGNNSGTTSTPKETYTYDAKLTVTKHDGNDSGLANAGFVLKKVVDGTTYYYKYTAATASSPASVTWVTNINEATEYFSKNDGKLYAGTKSISNNNVTITFSETDSDEKTFSGLSDGAYILEESTVPAGYNKAADYSFTVNTASTKDATTAKNLAQSTTVVNKSGSELPKTGGAGTVAFTIVGAALVVTAGVLLVTRRRMQQ